MSSQKSYIETLYPSVINILENMSLCFTLSYIRKDLIDIGRVLFILDTEYQLCDRSLFRGLQRCPEY